MSLMLVLMNIHSAATSCQVCLIKGDTIFQDQPHCSSRYPIRNRSLSTEQEDLFREHRSEHEHRSSLEYIQGSLVLAL